MKTAEMPFDPPSNARIVHLDDFTVDQARDCVVEALSRSGFAVVAEIDLQDLLRRRIDLRVEPHVVLEVCRPELAGRALAVSSDASLLMPCKVGVWKEGRGAAVGLLPATRLAVALGREHLAEVASEVEEELEDVLAALSTAVPLPQRRPRAVQGPSLALSEGERQALIGAVRSRSRALLAEAAGTEKHDLQHELATDMDQLEAILRKLGASS